MHSVGKETYSNSILSQFLATCITKIRNHYIINDTGALIDSPFSLEQA